MQMTNALAYIQQAATQDSTSTGTQASITTGFSTGKKLPHEGAKRLQSAAPGL